MARTYTIEKAVIERDDELEYVVLSRANSAIEIVDAEAKYHCNCYANFLKSPQDNAFTQAFEKLFLYIREKLLMLILRVFFYFRKLQNIFQNLQNCVLRGHRRIAFW